MHQYNQTRRVPQLHAGVGGMAGLQTEVAQLQNGDVVRLQGEEVPGLLAPTFGSNSQIHNAVKPLTQNLQRRPAENSVQSVKNNLNILGPRHNCKICCKQFLQILPGRSVGS